MPVYSSNPVFNERTYDRLASAPGFAKADRMTVRGALDRATILFALAFVTAAISWVTVVGAPGLALPALVVGSLVAFVLAMVLSFNPARAPFLAPAYAVAEGAALGALSAVMEARYPGIALQAILGTGIVTGVMLVLYRFRVVRATPTFTKVVVGLTLGAAILYGVALIASLFGANVSFLRDASPFGIGLSLFLIGLAASNLVIDFDVIERGEATRQPKAFEWYAAFGVLVTVAWLYVEILRLLARLNSRRD